MASKTRRGRRHDARLSIIDISLEDDSLLPLFNKGNNDTAMGGARDAEDVKEKRETDPHQADEMQVQLPEESDNKKGPQDPVDQQVLKSSQPSRPAFRRKKTSGHNSLRKSLAWDKAFLTGEGVLDPDELPISTRSPKRLPELPIFDVHARTTPTSNLPAELDSDRSHGSRSDNKHVLVEEGTESAALNLRSCSERFDMGRWKEPVMPSIQEYQETASHKPQPNAAMRHLSGPIIPRPLPAKKVIESAIQKGTRLRLPSTFLTRNEDKQTVAHVMKQQNEKASSTSSLTKRVSSVSRKVKDTLGKVLPGRSSNKHGSPMSIASSESSGRSTPTRVSAAQIKLLPETSMTALSSGAEATEGSSSAEVNSAYSESCHVGVGVLSNIGEEHSGSGNLCLRSDGVGAACAPKLSSRNDASYFRSKSTGSRLKPNMSLLEESSTSRFKPTGLKMPSPKLGFFDPGRAFHPAHTSTATTGRAARIDCSHNSTHYSSRSKPQGLPKGKAGNEPAERVSSAIPSAPHLRIAEKELTSIYQVTSAPSTLRKIHNELLSPAAHSALSNASLTPKGKLNESRSSARKLGLGDEAHRACDQYVHGGFRAENGCTSSSNCDVRHPGERSARFNEEVFGRKGVPKLKHLEICTASMGICASQGKEQSVQAHSRQLTDLSGIDQCFESRFTSEPSGARQPEAKSEIGKTCIENSSVQPDQGVPLSTEIDVDASRIGSSDSSSRMNSSENSGAEELLKSWKLKSKTEQFDEDTSSHWSDWPVLAHNLTSPQLGSHQVKPEKHKIVVLESDGAAKSPLAVNSGLLNAGPHAEQQKEKGSIFAFAKKTVGLLLQENTSGQENELGEPTRKHKRTWASDAADTRIHSAAENRSCTLEASREEKLVKTAPVQHSPPNKTEPQPGPWSPVRRNGVQLGPFDCTKLNAPAVGWDLT